MLSGTDRVCTPITLTSSIPTPTRSSSHHNHAINARPERQYAGLRGGGRDVSSEISEGRIGQSVSVYFSDDGWLRGVVRRKTGEHTYNVDFGGECHWLSLNPRQSKHRWRWHFSLGADIVGRRAVIFGPLPQDLRAAASRIGSSINHHNAVTFCNICNFSTRTGEHEINFHSSHKSNARIGELSCHVDLTQLAEKVCEKFYLASFCRACLSLWLA
jgi:hypothetical protein